MKQEAYISVVFGSNWNIDVEKNKQNLISSFRISELDRLLNISVVPVGFRLRFRQLIFNFHYPPRKDMAPKMAAHLINKYLHR